jgi:multidrug efflux pump
MSIPSIAGSSSSSGSNAGIVSSAAQGRGPGLPTASVIRLRDVARLDLGALNYTQACTFDGKPSVGLSVYQLPGTNALDVAKAVRDKMEELKTRFPDGVDYDIGYDTTPFTRESVMDVLWTLLEAVLLVGVVVLIFLQSWRSVLIPLVAVPVAIIGTFAVMAALTAVGTAMQWPTFQFSLNNISLFGLVLAIGIVVDDAIVVVENVERWMEHGLSPRDATRKAMGEVTGPIIAVGLVLCAVFVPCAFITGITGQFFRQFGVTIAVSTVFSAFNSLTLSPALAAILLKPKGGRRDPLTWVLDMMLGWFFWLFNKVFGFSTAAYAWTVGKFLRINIVVLVVYAGLLAMTYWAFMKAPVGFIPQQDQGRLICNVQLPDSASLERTQQIVKQVEKITLAEDGVAHTVAFSGTSFLLQASSPNFASLLVVLKPFDERKDSRLRDTAIMARLRKKWAEQIKDAVVTVYGASPIPGLGTAGGFKIIIEDRGGLGLAALQDNTEQVVKNLKTLPGMNSVATQFRSNTPQWYLDIDRDKTAAMGVSLDDVNQTLDMFLGSRNVGIFNEFGRHWQVTVQADGKYRNRIEAINLFKVRNNKGQMVPLGTLVTPREIGGPISVSRYNLSTAASISGNVQGVSTGDAIKNINRVTAETLPLSMKTEWTEIMFMQIRAGNTAMFIFLLSILCVFLALSALYESWALPLAVILVVPLCLLCSLASVLPGNRDVNIFVQIGLVVLVGLACKNAILIVEFAKQLHTEGMPLAQATTEASRLRLRPILMTSFAFIFGVIPLTLASGAGAEMRRSLGTAVFSGMLGVTIFGIFLTPVFFYVIQRLSETALFEHPIVRWIGSTLTGGFLGGATGFLFGMLRLFHPLAGMLVGMASGMLIVLVLLELHRRLQPSLEVMDALRLRPPRNGANHLPGKNSNGITGDPHP